MVSDINDKIMSCDECQGKNGSLCYKCRESQQSLLSKQARNMTVRDLDYFIDSWLAIVDVVGDMGVVFKQLKGNEDLNPYTVRMEGDGTVVYDASYEVDRYNGSIQYNTEEAPVYAMLTDRSWLKNAQETIAIREEAARIRGAEKMKRNAELAREEDLKLIQSLANKYNIKFIRSDDTC